MACWHARQAASAVSIKDYAFVRQAMMPGVSILPPYAAQSALLGAGGQVGLPDGLAQFAPDGTVVNLIGSPGRSPESGVSRASCAQGR